MLNYNTLSNNNYKFVVGLDFTEPVFVHAVLHMSSHFSSLNSWSINTAEMVHMF